MKKALIAMVITGALTSPAWALFESNKELISTARIPLEDAVKSALGVVPGKAVEAEIGKNDGRTVFVVEIIDRNNKSQKVYVDAQTGQTKMDK